MASIERISNRASRSAAWIAYIFIFFEMLYMSTPFAVFFYSVYGMPLRFLNKSGSTSWLIQHIFPHFTQTNSLLINTLMVISWPLMAFGLLLFIVAFGQIYWAKFRDKGAVIGGLYRFIRHPQYAALSIFGLGMAIFWSRMIVIIMYVSMLFVYYFLAKKEERECLEKYGESYRIYVEKTGRFLPRFSKQRFYRPKKILPERGPNRLLALTAFYLVTVFFTIGLGLGTRSYSLSEISTVSGKDSAVISVSQMGQAEMETILSIVKSDKNAMQALGKAMDSTGQKQLIYIVPLKWTISELAMEVEGAERHHHGYHPTTHGNPIRFDPSFYKVLFSEAVVDDRTEGKDILSKTRAQRPLLLVKVDLMNKRVTGMEKPPEQGKYGDIPVPIF